MARLDNREEADEVLQEVALAAASQSARGQAIERVGPWLYRVALRQVLLLRRKQGRRRRLITNMAANMTSSDMCGKSDSPLDWVLSQERGAMVRSALELLGERDRQLLLLKYVDGLSYEEIARAIGVTASSVQSRLHRARIVLRQQLIRVEVAGHSTVDVSV